MPPGSAGINVRKTACQAGKDRGSLQDGAHNDLAGSHNKVAAKTDKPISALLRNTRKTDSLRRGIASGFLPVWRRACAAFALLTNLRARGLLDSTLVILMPSACGSLARE